MRRYGIVGLHARTSAPSMTCTIAPKSTPSTRSVCCAGSNSNFADKADMRPVLAARPVYLAMAVEREFRLKLKPQNMLVNLPLARSQ
jgi:hypothetical protein